MQKLRQLSAFVMVSGLTLRSANHVRSELAGHASIHFPITLNRHYETRLRHVTHHYVTSKYVTGWQSSFLVQSL